MQILLDVLSEMSRSNAISLVPHHQEVSTQEAANLLNVSRPFLVNLLKKEKNPYRMVDSHRRVRLREMMEYKERIDWNPCVGWPGSPRKRAWGTEYLRMSKFTVVYDACVLYPAPLRDTVSKLREHHQLL